jgi:hypothetical protein
MRIENKGVVVVVHLNTAERYQVLKSLVAFDHRANAGIKGAEGQNILLMETAAAGSPRLALAVEKDPS